MALVSVIVPTCDRAALLPRAVCSVLAQTHVNLELLIVDNNRREPPVHKIFGSAPWFADRRIKVVQPATRRNAAAARNAGLAVAAGEWMTYLDDDDVYRPTKIRRQLELAEAAAEPLVLCGAEFHLRGRIRPVQCAQQSWSGDDLLLQARWNTPLLFHRRFESLRFDETLSPGEDAEFAHRILAKASAGRVQIVPEALVEIHPQSGPRVNANPAPVRPAAARILALRRDFFSRAARRRYVLLTLLAVAKLTRQRKDCLALSWRTLRESRGRDWRSCANALAVSFGIFPDRWVS